MIQNEHQYKVTQGAIKKLQQAVATMLENTEKVAPPPDQASGIQASFQQQIDHLQAQLQEYDDLKAGKRTITIKSIEDLPKVLIQKRISLGMTQRELAEKLGIKEQMLQRYESTGYESIGFQRLTEIWNTLNASIPEMTVRGKTSVVALPIQELFLPQSDSKNSPHYASKGKTISQSSSEFTNIPLSHDSSLAVSLVPALLGPKKPKNIVPSAFNLHELCPELF